jgi:hypothetical protein
MADHIGAVDQGTTRGGEGHLTLLYNSCILNSYNVKKEI